MNAENFVYWLNGYFELGGSSLQLGPTQIQVIKDHIALVLNKKTPNYFGNSCYSYANLSASGVTMKLNETFYNEPNTC